MKPKPKPKPRTCPGCDNGYVYEKKKGGMRIRKPCPLCKGKGVLTD